MNALKIAWLTGVEELRGIWDQIRDTVDRTGGWLQKAWDAGLQQAAALVLRFVDALPAAWETVKEGFSQAAEALKPMWDQALTYMASASLGFARKVAGPLLTILSSVGPAATRAAASAGLTALSALEIAEAQPKPPPAAPAKPPVAKRVRSALEEIAARDTTAAAAEIDTQTDAKIAAHDQARADRRKKMEEEIAAIRAERRVGGQSRHGGRPTTRGERETPRRSDRPGVNRIDGGRLHASACGRVTRHALPPSPHQSGLLPANESKACWACSRKTTPPRKLPPILATRLRRSARPPIRWPPVRSGWRRRPAFPIRLREHVTMTTHVHETVGSRALTAGIDRGTELDWHLTVTGNASSLTTEVWPAMSSVFPATVLDPVWLVTLVRGRIKINNVARGVWQGVMTYIDPARADDTQKLDVGDFRMEVSTTGGTARIFASETPGTNYVKAGVSPIDFKCAIGVSGDPVNGEVAGVELAAVPCQRRTITYRQPKAIVTQAYLKTVRTLTGRTNNATFYSAAIGESLFFGADIAMGINSDPTGTFHFLEGDNRTGITIGEIVGIAKTAWQYLWVYFEPAKDTTAKVTRRIPHKSSSTLSTRPGLSPG